MRLSKHIYQEAKRWVRLSLDETQRVSEERVKAVLEITEAQYKPLRLKNLLKAYYYFLSLELSRTNAVLEYAGDFTPEAQTQLNHYLNRASGRNVAIKSKQNPELIAGFRVSLGDFVWEDTISSRLNRLHSSL